MALVQLQDTTVQSYSVRKTGQEPFTCHGQPIGVPLLHFWQWASSNVIGDPMWRGVLGQYLVTLAVGQADDTLDAYEPVDLRLDDLHIQVKTSS